MKRVREESDGNKERDSTNEPVVHVTDEADKKPIDTNAESSKCLSKRNSDEGHRYGNFHNYYAFHASSNRTKHLDEILMYMTNQWNGFNPTHDRQAFRYTDVGCNEGDLTLQVAKLISNHLSTFSPNGKGENNATVTEPQHQPDIATLICTGFDLDSDLIQQAQLKVQGDVELQPKIKATFKIVDVIHEDITSQYEGMKTSSEIYCTDFTSIFSTTMWIHIHGGDDGLRRVLQQICSCTRYWILLEPQPSKCYGKAAFRLRRLGLQPIDASNERLRLRSNIEENIEIIMKECQFDRVNFKCKSYTQNGCDSIASEQVIYEEGDTETRTQWNRSLRLYQRANIPSNLLQAKKGRVSFYEL